ncbi:ABC transporter ATP-binding protein [Thermogemmatispora onikobensis]|uniref:ABC transporter ATP-binding protein n=1 Tax=Thermogemmatispora onikobensis TaxID=732234 RepID=UPI0008530E5E|nr:ABC transporter ATP-binding protein [Thermogemmatispora onikobensis]
MEAAQRPEQPLRLTVSHLSKSYPSPAGPVEVLHGLSFEVEGGELLAVTGPSGTGKTTLLMLLGALDRPDEGEIWLGEQAVHRLRGRAAADFRRRTVGFVFQLFYLLPHLTALENVMVPLLPYRRRLDFDLRTRATELLERVGMGHRLGYPPAKLSGGEQQRVAIARALIHSPQVLLADEPTGNLDPTTARNVLALLREVQRREGQMVIVATHDPQIATMADRQIRLGSAGEAAP